MKKRIEVHPIERVINGAAYSANRVVEGTRVLTQTVHFMGRVEPDNDTYKVGQEKKMAMAADLIFWALVTRGWPGQSPLEPQAADDQSP